MAIDSNSYFSNQAAVGLGGATAGQFNKFDLHATPKYALGFKVECADGSTYRYAHLGAATNRGLLVGVDLSESAVVDTDNVVIASASAVAVSGEAALPGAIGSRFVQITLASVTANQYRGGKFITTDDTGEGFTYDIIGNTATDNPATGDFRLELAQPLVIALGTTTDFAIAANQYANLEGVTAGTDEIPVGVTCNTSTAALPYGWIQTKGVVGILQDGTINLGDIVCVSDGVTGAVHTLGGGGTDVADIITEPIVGTCLDPGDTTGHGVFKINLE